MKKGLLIFVLCLFPFSAFANAKKGDYIIFASIEGRGVFTDKAITITEGANLETPNLTLKFNNDYAVRAGIGARFKKFDLGFYYYKLNNTDHKISAETTKTNSLPSFKNSIPLAFGEGGGIGYDKSFDGNNVTGSAIGNFSLIAFDFEAGFIFQLNQGVTLRLITGLRYGEYKQDHSTIRQNECRSDICNADSIAKGTERNFNQEFAGFGPRLGLSVYAPIRDSKFGLVGASTFTILFTEMQTQDLFTEITTGTSITRETPSLKQLELSNRFATIKTFGIEGGLEYEYSSSLFIESGYRYQKHYRVLYTHGKSQYFNKAPGNNNIIRNNIYGERKDDLVLHGPYLKVVYKF